MLKLIKKTGLNVGIAFAFLFVTSMIVAKEKVVTSDKMDVTRTTEVKVLAGSPKVSSTEEIMTLTYYFSGPSNSDEHIRNRENWKTSPGSLNCVGTTYLCQVVIDAGEYDDINDFLTLHNTAAEIKTNAESYTERDL